MSPTPTADRPEERRAALLVDACLLLAVGASASSGFMRRSGPLEWLALACVTGAAALWSWAHAGRSLPGAPSLRTSAGGGLLLFALAQPFFLWRMVHHQAGPLAATMRVLALGAAVLIVAHVAMGRRDRHWDAARRTLFLAAVSAALILQVLLILDSPDPGPDRERFFRSWASDIYASTNGGAGALLRGENPYTATYPPRDARGRNLVDFYVYPPGNLLLSLPGRLLMEDVRYSYVLAMAGAAGLLWALSRGARAWEREALVLLLLHHPRALYLYEQAFTEPIVALVAVAVALAAATSRPLLAGALFGILVMSKQYAVTFALGLARARLPARAWGAAAVAAALLLAPFALWDARALWDNLVLFHLRTPQRYEALNWVTALHRLTGAAAPSLLWVAGVAVVPALVRQPPGAPGIVGTGGLVLLFCFLFGKYAFFNYYWLAGVLALVCAAAHLRAPASGKEPDDGQTAG